MCTNWDMYDSKQKGEDGADDKAKVKKSTLKDDKQSDLVSTATKSKSSLATGTSNKWLSFFNYGFKYIHKEKLKILLNSISILN